MVSRKTLPGVPGGVSEALQPTVPGEGRVEEGKGGEGRGGEGRGGEGRGGKGVVEIKEWGGRHVSES